MRTSPFVRLSSPVFGSALTPASQKPDNEKPKGKLQNENPQDDWVSVEVPQWALNLQEKLDALKGRVKAFFQSLHPQNLQQKLDTSYPVDSDLFHALKVGDQTSIRANIEQLADPNLRNKNGNTVLYVAAVYGETEAIELLVKKGADVNAQNRDNETALHGAVKYGELKAIETLLKAGVDVNAQGAYKNTPLHMASRYANGKIIQVLMANGADPALENSAGITPVKAAVSARNWDAVQEFLPLIHLEKVKEVVFSDSDEPKSILELRSPSINDVLQR